MTINEFIFQVLQAAGISSDDFPVSKRFVYNAGKNAYRELTRQDLNKLRLWDSGSAQTIPCFELERADAASCLDCDSGLYVLKSKEPIPDLIETDHGSAIIGVYLLNGVSINPISRADWQNRKKRRYSLPGSYGYFRVNGYLYIVDYDDVDELLVDVEGFFNDPEDIDRIVRSRSGCSNELRCTPVYEYEFRCPGHLLRRIVELTVQIVLRRLAVPDDSDNNAKPDLNVPSNPQLTR